MAFVKKIRTVEEFYKLSTTRKKEILKHSCCNYSEGKCIFGSKKCKALSDERCNFVPIVVESYKQFYNIE